VKQYLLDKLASFLGRRATPYFHLYGYMMRWWLVPYSRVVLRTLPEDEFGPEIITADGTGPVSFSHRPIAWVFQRLGLAIRLHDILRSDEGRDPHDHPWPYLTVILRGGYWEERYNDTGEVVDVQWRGPGSVLFRRAGSWHKLVLPGEMGQRCAPCTTLFITGPYVQSWGFNVNGVKVPWREYKQTGGPGT